MKNKEQKLYYLYAFLLSLIVSMIIIIPKMLENKGIYILVGDFNVQQIPFLKIINSSIKSGDILWSWHNDLGSNFIGTFSFYNLLSPFTIISLLFSENFVPYLIGPLCILRIAVSGLASYIYLERYVKNRKYALLGSLFYAFSGFQITNYMFHFYDSIALFPLLLFALDEVMIKKKKGLLAIIIAVLALTNYFMFIGEGVFLVIYFLVKIFTKDYKVDKEKIKIIVLETILGIGLTAFILIPTYYFMIGNPRTDLVFQVKDLFIYPFRVYLQIYKSLIMAPDIMPLYSLYTTQSWTSTEAYLPFVGFTLAISYIIKKPKSSISILIYISLIMMFVPVLNSIFLLLNQSYYSRWFYMPILIFSLASIKTMEENINIRYGSLITIFLFIMLPFLIIDFTNSDEYIKLIYNVIPLIIILLITIISFISLNIIYKFKTNRFRIILCCTIVSSILISNFNIYYGSYYYSSSTNHRCYYEYIFADKYLDFEDKNVRIDSFIDDNANLTMNLDNPSMRSFSSTANGSIFDFYKLIGSNRTVKSKIEDDDYSLRTFLSNKYLIAKATKYQKTSKTGFTYTVETKIKEVFSYKIIHIDNDYSIYENTNYLPMGYTFDKYINEDDFKKESYAIWTPALLKGLILNSEQIKKYSKYMEPITLEELTRIKEEDFVNDVNNRKREASSKTIFDKNTFTSEITLNKDNLIFYSIPYDEGFRAYVNGKEVKIEKVDAGFMAVLGNAGGNVVKFKYYPKGLNTGLIISSISLLGLVIYLLKEKRKV